VGEPEGTNLLGRHRILKIKDERVWTGFIWLRIGSSGGFVNTVMNICIP
jgi:hypothetical protein